MRTKSTVIIGLPPESSAYVEALQDLLPPRAEEVIAALKQDGGQHEPPDEPHDHGHEHVEDGGRRPVLRRIIPTSGSPGATITLVGDNFGSALGKVLIDGVEATIV